MGGYWTFSTPIFVYLVINIMDHVTPKLSRVSSPLKKGQAKTGGASHLFPLAILFWPFAQVASILWCLLVSSDASLSIIEILGLVLSVGVMAGAVGITFAHELYIEKNVGRELLVKSCFYLSLITIGQLSTYRGIIEMSVLLKTQLLPDWVRAFLLFCHDRYLVECAQHFVLKLQKPKDENVCPMDSEIGLFLA